MADVTVTTGVSPPSATTSAAAAAATPWKNRHVRGLLASPPELWSGASERQGRVRRAILSHATSSCSKRALMFCSRLNVPPSPWKLPVVIRMPMYWRAQEK